MKYEVSEEFIDAAVELTAFCRINPYPQFGTPEFIKLTHLVDVLDTQVRRFQNQD